MIDLFRKIRNYGITQSLAFGLHESKRLFINRLFLGSFSLDGEDLIIDRLCGHKKNGFYVDVGACHPTRLSNTRYFYDKGWRGMNIEANPSLLPAFTERRPRDINLNVGAGTHDTGTLDFFVMFPPTLGTFSREFMDMNVSRGNEYIRTEKIPVLKLSTILEKHLPPGTEIDFISVDAEGRDFDVIQSGNWEKFRPKVVCVESVTRFYNVPFEPTIFPQIEFFNRVGYELAYHNGMDAFYIRK
jgi:FkbM family methyltransferase